jgi:hypothetical protein
MTQSLGTKGLSEVDYFYAVRNGTICLLFIVSVGSSKLSCHIKNKLTCLLWFVILVCTFVQVFHAFWNQMAS